MRDPSLLRGAFLDMSEDRTRRIGELAVGRGWISAAQLEDALRSPVPGPAGTVFVARGWIDDAKLKELTADAHGRGPAAFLAPSRPVEVPPEAAALAGDPDRSFDRYVLVAEIGRGAMGTVWRAWDRGLGRWCALKILRDESTPELRGRFLREVQTAASLRDPHIVTVYDAGEWRGRPFLSMELIEGRALDLRRPLETTVSILRKVARGLDQAHRKGVVHRDLKPGNIVVDAAGEPHIVDFGLAHLVASEEKLTRTGATLGTPAYMAPEQVEGRPGEISAATDVYALGAILYEAIAGRTPHSGETTIELLRSTIHDDPLPPQRLSPRAPRDLCTIAMKALERPPQRRYAGAGAFADELERHQRGEPILARPVGDLTRLVRTGLRHRKVILPVAAVLVVAGAGLAWNVTASARRARDEAAALVLLEQARPAIEKATLAFYRADVDVAEARREVQDARATLEAAVKTAPHLPLGHYLLGRAWELEGDEPQAHACWKRALDLDPTFTPARVQRARLLVVTSFMTGVAGQGRPEDAARMAGEALAELRQATGAGVEDDMLRRIAEALRAYLDKDPAAVRRIAGEGIARFGRAEGTEQLHWLIGLVSQGDEQRRAYDEALAIRPKDPGVLLCRAHHFYLRRDRESAVRDCSEALKMRPAFVPALLLRAEALGASGRAEEAERDYTAAIAIEPGQYIAWFNRGNLRSGLRNWTGAIEDYTQSLAHWPGHDASLLYRGRARLELKDHAGATADFSETLRLNPLWWEPWYDRARVSLLLDRKREAVGDLKKALEVMDADSPHRERVTLLLKETERALEY